MSGRLSALLATLRPRTIARTVKSVEDLVVATRDLRRTAKHLEDAGSKAEERAAAVEAELRALKTAIFDLQLRESRLRAIYQREVEQAPLLVALDSILNAGTIAAHLQQAVDASTVYSDPFPHLVLEHLFPESFYDAVIGGIPPVELFDGADNKQRIVVPFEMAPAFSRRVWSFLLHEVVDRSVPRCFESSAIR